MAGERDQDLDGINAAMPTTESAEEVKHGFYAHFERLPDIAFWLKFQHDLSEEPLVSVDSDNQILPLGQVNINDKLLQRVNGGIAYDSLEQEYMYTVNIIVQHEEDNSSPPIGLDMLFKTMFGEEDGEEKDQRRSQSNRKIGVPYGPESMAILDLAVDEDGDYNLSMRSEYDEELKDFDIRSRIFAHMLSLVVNNLYKSLNKDLADEDLTFAPPKHIVPHLETARKGINMQKSMLPNHLNEGIVGEVEANVLMVKAPDVRFTDIGGQEEAKEVLDDAVFGLLHPEIFAEEGSDVVRAVLLSGPAGTGKSLLAYAAAGEAGVSTYDVHIADIVDPFVGKSEKTLHSVFKEAIKHQPAVIILDEIDALGGQQSQFGTNTEVRLTKVLQTNLQDIHSRGDRVLVVATTNYKGDLENPLKRAGRFDKALTIDLPTPQERVKIFDVHLGKASSRANGKPIFAEGIDLEALAGKTEGLSGADIAEIIRRVTHDRVKARRSGATPERTTLSDILKIIDCYEKDRRKKVLGYQITQA